MNFGPLNWLSSFLILPYDVQKSYSIIHLVIFRRYTVFICQLLLQSETHKLKLTKIVGSRAVTATDAWVILSVSMPRAVTATD